jgi:hypothetical protein
MKKRVLIKKAGLRIGQLVENPRDGYKDTQLVGLIRLRRTSSVTLAYIRSVNIIIQNFCTII